MKMDHRVLMPIELLIIYLSTELRVNSGIGPLWLGDCFKEAVLAKS